MSMQLISAATGYYRRISSIRWHQLADKQQHSIQNMTGFIENSVGYAYKPILLGLERNSDARSVNLY